MPKRIELVLVSFFATSGAFLLSKFCHCTASITVPMYLRLLKLKPKILLLRKEHRTFFYWQF